MRANQYERIRRKEESEMFYKNNIEYFIFPIFSETFYFIFYKKKDESSVCLPAISAHLERGRERRRHLTT